MSLKRLTKEWIRVLNRPTEGISMGPFGDDMFHWEAVIIGPPGTPYEGEAFMLEVIFPYLYPFRPPKVRFKTPMNHPYIDSEGAINIDILRESWAPSITIEKVLLNIRLLLAEPNTDKPLVPDISI